MILQEVPLLVPEDGIDPWNRAKVLAYLSQICRCRGKKRITPEAILRWISKAEREARAVTWRGLEGAEVDFVIEDYRSTDPFERRRLGLWLSARRTKEGWRIVGHKLGLFEQGPLGRFDLRMSTLEEVIR